MRQPWGYNFPGRGRPPISGSMQFGHVNCAAGLVAHQINFGGIANVDGQAPWHAPGSGVLAWFSASLSEPAAGDTLTAQIYKDGVHPPQLPFAMHANFDVRISTPAGWTALTADLGAAFGFILDGNSEA